MLYLQEREAFLQQFRFTGSTEDFEVAMRAYEWPKKFAGNLREASGKANSGRRLLLAGCHRHFAVAYACASGCARCLRLSLCLCLGMPSAHLIGLTSCSSDIAPYFPWPSAKHCDLNSPWIGVKCSSSDKVCYICRAPRI